MDLDVQGMMKSIFSDLCLVQQLHILMSILSRYRRVAALALLLLYCFSSVLILPRLAQDFVLSVLLTVLGIRHFQVSIVPDPL